MLAAGVFALYVPALGHGFLYDDHEVILAQQAPRSAADVARYFAEPHGLPLSGLPYYRPVVRATLLVQKALHGDAPAPFRALNAALAALAAVLAFAWLRAPALGVAPLPAFLAAALFASTPVASSVVYPIASGRETLLPATLALLAITAYARGGRGARGVSVLAFAAALFGKESMLVVPGVMALADALRVSAEPPGRSVQHWLRRYAPFGLVAATYLVARARILDLPSAGHLLSALADHPAGPLLSLVYALQVVIAPFAELHYEPALEGWLSPVRAAAACAAAVALVALAAGPGPVARRRTLFWLGAFAVLWLPTANVLPQEAPFAERYVFLASLALPALAATGLSARWERPGWRRVGVAIGLLVLAASAAATLRLGAAYRDDRAFYTQWVRTRPDHANAHFCLGTALAREGAAEEAAGHLAEAARLDPRHAAARFNLAVLLARQGRVDDAARRLEEALRIEPRDADARFYLGVLREQQGRPQEAVILHREALRLRPGWEEPAARLAALGATP